MLFLSQKFARTRIVNNNRAEYDVPTSADVGSIEAVLVDEVDPNCFRRPRGPSGYRETFSVAYSAQLPR